MNPEETSATFSPDPTKAVLGALVRVANSLPVVRDGASDKSRAEAILGLVEAYQRLDMHPLRMENAKAMHVLEQQMVKEAQAEDGKVAKSIVTKEGNPYL